MKLPAPALIRITGPRMVVDRIAAFTWITKSGIAWLEDSYLDPYGGGRVFRVLDGKLLEQGGIIYMECKDGHALILSQEQVRAEPELCPENLREPLQNARDVFATDFGKDWEQEYTRMTKVLADELKR